MTKKYLFGSIMTMIVFQACSINNKNIKEPLTNRQLAKEIRKEPRFDEIYQIKEHALSSPEIKYYKELNSITYGELKSFLTKILKGNYLTNSIKEATEDYYYCRKNYEEAVLANSSYHLGKAKDNDWNKKIQFVFDDFVKKDNSLNVRLISNINYDFVKAEYDLYLVIKLHLNLKDKYKNELNDYLNISLNAHQVPFYSKVIVGTNSCKEYILEIPTEMKEVINKYGMEIFEINTHIISANGIPNEPEFNIYTDDLYRNYLISEYNDDGKSEELLNEIIRRDYGVEYTSFDEFMSRKLLSLFTKKEIEIMFLLTL